MHSSYVYSKHSIERSSNSSQYDLAASSEYIKIWVSVNYARKQLVLLVANMISILPISTAFQLPRFPASLPILRWTLSSPS